MFMPDRPGPVFTEKTECQDCYKCVRSCPIKSIQVTGGAATILLDECVYCGHCTKICPSKAKRIRNDLDKVKALFNTGKPVYASVAPAVIAEFASVGLETFAGALAKLGFAGMSETAHGADAVSRAAVAEIESKFPSQKLFISTACPSIVRYVERHAPQFVPFLSDSASPLHVHATMLRQTFGDIHVVFIGPCAAKKTEADLHPEVIDAAIGFTELASWLAGAGIDLTTLSEQERRPLVLGRPSKGLLYPFDSGMCRSLESFMKTEQERPQMISISGLPGVIRALRFDPSTLERPLFLELLACDGGCINGPMMRRKDSLLSKQLDVERHARQYGLSAPALESPGAKLQWEAHPVVSQSISAEAVTKALHTVGKFQPEDELNCSGCGYDSCRDFAKALAAGKAEKTMCVSYMRNLAQKKANSIMETMPSGVAVVNTQGMIVECNHQFARILGPETEKLYECCPGLSDAELEALIPGLGDYVESVLQDKNVDQVSRTVRLGSLILQVRIFGIEKGYQAGVLIQDCTVPRIQRDRIIEQARKVIEKNLSTVQNIAFLLGENAAESEVILNSIVETFSEEEGGEAQ